MRGFGIGSHSELVAVMVFLLPAENDSKRKKMRHFIRTK
jgi:hypothetical protein